MSEVAKENPCPAGAQAAMPLPLAAEGQEVFLAGVDAGRRLQHRLAELGLIPGVRFRVLKRTQSGPFIIALGDARLVLGRGMVSRMRVCPL